MSNYSGFLVVEKHAKQNARLPNVHYRGLGTRVPWDQREYEKGWNDPLVFGDYTDQRFLIRSLALARDVLSRYAEIRPREGMEIMYVRTWEEPPQVPLDSLGPDDLHFLGYDVAYERGPFYSVVGDFPSLPIFRIFLERLNEHGLFCSPHDAKAYLEFYRAQKLYEWEQTYVVWEVYLETRASEYA
jgi:hypothetical protein